MRHAFRRRARAFFAARRSTADQQCPSTTLIRAVNEPELTARLFQPELADGAAASLLRLRQLGLEVQIALELSAGSTGTCPIDSPYTHTTPLGTASPYLPPLPHLLRPAPSPPHPRAYPGWCSSWAACRSRTVSTGRSGTRTTRKRRDLLPMPSLIHPTRAACSNGRCATGRARADRLLT